MVLGGGDNCEGGAEGRDNNHKYSTGTTYVQYTECMTVCHSLSSSSESEYYTNH